ncbi:MAG: hypothetical protein WCK48_02865 [bacterium]
MFAKRAVYNKGTEFIDGYDFERFCAGFDASSVGLKLYGTDVKRFSFEEALVNSVHSAVSRGCTHIGLRESGGFFYRVYCEVRQQLPKPLRRKLRLVTTLGTALDFFYGSDFVFLLNKSFVLVDATLRTFDEGKQSVRGNYSYRIFTPYQTDQKAVVALARTIARDLRDGEESIQDEVFSQIKGLVYSTKPNSS